MENKTEDSVTIKISRNKHDFLLCLRSRNYFNENGGYDSFFNKGIDEITVNELTKLITIISYEKTYIKDVLYATVLFTSFCDRICGDDDRTVFLSSAMFFFSRYDYERNAALYDWKTISRMTLSEFIDYASMKNDASFSDVRRLFKPTGDAVSDDVWYYDGYGKNVGRLFWMTDKKCGHHWLMQFDAFVVYNIATSKKLYYALDYLKCPFCANKRQPYGVQHNFSVERFTNGLYGQIFKGTIQSGILSNADKPECKLTVYCEDDSFITTSNIPTNGFTNPNIPIVRRKESYVLPYDEKGNNKMTFKPVFNMRDKDGFQMYCAECSACKEIKITNSRKLYMHINGHKGRRKIQKYKELFDDYGETAKTETILAVADWILKHWKDGEREYSVPVEEFPYSWRLADFIFLRKGENITSEISYDDLDDERLVSSITHNSNEPESVYYTFIEGTTREQLEQARNNYEKRLDELNAIVI